METWKRAIDFPEYEVSDFGNVRRVTAAKGTYGGKILKPYNSNGYLKVCLISGEKKRKVSVHRLVLETFAGKPDGKLDCCHGNGIRADNRLSNLRWATRSENMLDAKKHGTSAIGEKNGHAILTKADVLEIRNRRASGERISEITKDYNVTRGAISDICRRVNWRHV